MTAQGQGQGGSETGDGAAGSTADPIAEQEVPAVPVGSGREAVRIVVDRGARRLTNPRWGTTEIDHGQEAEVLVDAPADLEGRTVRFVIEQSTQGGWETLAEATATIEGGVATARVRFEHPAEAERTDLHFAEGVDTGPRTLRFHASVAGGQDS